MALIEVSTVLPKSLKRKKRDMDPKLDDGRQAIEKPYFSMPHEELQKNSGITAGQEYRTPSQSRKRLI